MNRESLAHNLRFALAALEEQLIDAHTLQQALSVWLQDQSVPLSEILIREKMVPEAERERIALLADTQAVAGSLAGADTESVDLGLLASVREALGRLGEAERDATVHRLLDEIPAPSTEPALGDKGDDRFEILGEHARGGLGEVLLARDKHLNRRVALKRIRDQWAGHSEYRERFLQEAEFTGRLEHPGVVPVYALGKRADGRLYYAMRFIRGESLEQAISKYYERLERLPRSEQSVQFRQLLRRFVDVCNTIDFAHSRGVLHRDIKPANIMLGKYGETLVVDWGLAKQVDVDEQQLDGTDWPIASEAESGSAPTRLGSAVGTPPYMSPEQAAGRVDEVGAATDVFCLGATLYQLLTGQPPQTETSLSRILERVQRGEFLRPSEVRSEIPKPLEAICLKAMALQPAARYVTAGDLAADVERWLADEPVTVYREAVAARLVRAARRRPALTASAAVTFVLLCVAAVAANMIRQSALRREAEHQAELREGALLRRVEREKAATRRLAVAAGNLQAGREQLRAGRLLAALGLFQAGHDACADDERLDTEIREDIRQQRAHLAQRLDQVQQLVDYRRLSDQAMFASFFEMDRHSMILFEAAFERIGVFDHADWWAHLPIEDLHPRDADGLVRQVHFHLAMHVSIMGKNFVSPELLLSRSAGLPVKLTPEQQRVRQAISNGAALSQGFRRGQWVAHLDRGARYLAGDRPTLPTPPQWRGDNFNDCYCVGSTCMIQVQVGDVGFMRQFLTAFLGVEDVRATADELLNRAVALRPEEYWANFAIGTIRRQEGQYEAARRGYTQCITIRPDIPLTYNLRGLCAYQQALATEDEPEKLQLLQLALADATTAHGLDPDVEFNYWLRGFVYQHLDLPEDAAATMLAALHREIPAEMVARQRWAVSVMGKDLNLVRRTHYSFRNRFAEATGFAQQHLKREPSNHRYLALLAASELASGREEEALAAAERAATAAEEDPDVSSQDSLQESLLVQAEVRRRRGELEAAWELFSAVMSAEKQDAEHPGDAVRNALACDGMSSILEEQAEGASGRDATTAALDAYDDYVRAARTDWQQIRSRLGRCRLLLRLGREQEALRALDDVLRLDRGLDTPELRRLAEQHQAESVLARLDAIRPHVALAEMRQRVGLQVETLPLRNGGFELGLGEYWRNRTPEAPIWWNQGGCRSSAEIASDQRHGGEASMHIVHVSPPADARRAVTQQTIPAEAGRRYRISLWAKAASLEKNAVRIVIDDQPAAAIVLPAGSYDWQPLRGEFTAPGSLGDGLRDIRVRIVSRAPGESWLDDLRIQRIDRPEE
jgi:tetratricopeptide (TPR) repeat protein/tRNA A-37 threonylcarbamoyl transferase component Bud32